MCAYVLTVLKKFKNHMHKHHNSPFNLLKYIFRLILNFNMASVHRNRVSIKTMVITLARVTSFYPFNFYFVNINGGIYVLLWLCHGTIYRLVSIIFCFL